MHLSYNNPLHIHKAVVEFFLEGFLIEVLTYKHEFLLTVAIGLVPVATQSGIGGEQRSQFVLGHGGIPLSGIGKRHLFAGLLKEITDVRFALEVAQALGSNHTLRPSASHKIVEQTYIKRLARAIHICAYAIFLCLTFAIVVVMMVVVMVMFVMVVVIIIIVVMVVFVMVIIIVVVIIVMVVVFVLIVVVIVIIGRAFHFVNPSG